MIGTPETFARRRKCDRPFGRLRAERGDQRRRPPSSIVQPFVDGARRRQTMIEAIDHKSREQIFGALAASVSLKAAVEIAAGHTEPGVEEASVRQRSSPCGLPEVILLSLVDRRFSSDLRAGFRLRFIPLLRRSVEAQTIFR